MPGTPTSRAHSSGAKVKFTKRTAPTPPRRASLFVAWGFVLAVIGLDLTSTGNANYQTCIWTTQYYDSCSQTQAVVGSIIGLVGVVLLTVGIFRLVEHVDRLGGVRVEQSFVETKPPATPMPSTAKDAASARTRPPAVSGSE